DRYQHKNDQHEAPLDPNFIGCGRVLTDNEGRYRFTSIKPGAYPWRNHYNAWRPAHIHFSLFGPAFLTRLVTQMYFPGDPLMPLDPIFNSIPDEKARQRMISCCAVAKRRPWRNEMKLSATPNQTFGPYFHIGLKHLIRSDIAGPLAKGE